MDKQEMGKKVSAMVYEAASRQQGQEQRPKQETYEGTCKTWITSAGSTVSVFAVPARDQGGISVGVAVNNELTRDPRFNVFGVKQSERAIDTLLKCGGSPEQLRELTDFLHKNVRVAKVEKESELEVKASDRGFGAEYSSKKKITTN